MIGRLCVDCTLSRCSLVCPGIVEPFESWYDGVRERVDYYGGMDSYIFRGDLNVTWQVNPMNSVKTCFLTEGQPDVRPYMPDLTGFQLQDDAVQIDNQMVGEQRRTQKQRETMQN